METIFNNDVCNIIEDYDDIKSKFLQIVQTENEPMIQEMLSKRKIVDTYRNVPRVSELLLNLTLRNEYIKPQVNYKIINLLKDNGAKLISASTDKVYISEMQLHTWTNPSDFIDQHNQIIYNTCSRVKKEINVHGEYYLTNLLADEQSKIDYAVQKIAIGCLTDSELNNKNAQIIKIDLSALILNHTMMVNKTKINIKYDSNASLELKTELYFVTNPLVYNNINYLSFIDEMDITLHTNNEELSGWVVRVITHHLKESDIAIPTNKMEDNRTTICFYNKQNLYDFEIVFADI